MLQLLACHVISDTVKAADLVDGATVNTVGGCILTVGVQTAIHAEGFRSLGVRELYRMRTHVHIHTRVRIAPYLCSWILYFYGGRNYTR